MLVVVPSMRWLRCPQLRLTNLVNVVVVVEPGAPPAICVGAQCTQAPSAEDVCESLARRRRSSD